MTPQYITQSGVRELFWLAREDREARFKWYIEHYVEEPHCLLQDIPENRVYLN